MGDDYYGYSSADNSRLTDLRQFGRRTGENFTEYDDGSVGAGHFEGYKQTYKPPPGGDPNDPGSTNFDYWDKKDAYGRTGASGGGVEAIYHRIMAQDPAKVQALIDHWRGVAASLADVSDRITANTDKVGASWRSPGATQFMALGPGAALKSLSDWHLAALQTASALSVVHSALVDNQTTITAIYNEYLAEVKDYQKVIGGTGIDGAQDIKGNKLGFSQRYTQYVAEIQQKYTYRAQVVESALGDAYWDGYSGVVGSTPGIYEGPTNAVAAPPGVFFPGSPGAGRPPAAPPGVVPPGLTPTAPPVAPRAAPPGAPGKPITPVRTAVTPVAPRLAAPVTPLPPVAPPATPPGAPVAPIAPAAVPPGAIPPTPPTAGRMPAPPTRPLPPGAPAGPGLPPSALPKALAKGGVLGGPGNLPTAPGGAGRAPGAPGMPGGRRAPTAPQSKLARPVLGGSGPSAPPPGMPGGGRRPGAPGAPGGLRAGRPGLPGTPGSFPQSPFRNARSAAPPVLGGRAARPGEPGYGRPGAPGAPGSRMPGMPGAPGSRTPGTLGPGAPARGPQAPGATDPVLGRRGATPAGGGRPGTPSPGEPRNARRFGLRKLLPGGLSDPFGLMSRSRAAGPVLNSPPPARPVTGPVVGVPDALRGTSRVTPTETPAVNRPVEADLAARHHETAPVEFAAVVEVPAVRDEDVFAPQTPGGPVLAHGARPKDYEPEERVALPGGTDGRSAAH